jgi:dTDP-glucose 4,6-dehydratase
MKMSNRIVVIGSNSFSGASLIKEALEQGNEILGISRSPENEPCLLPYKWTNQEHFQFRQLDLNNHTDEIINEIKNFETTHVINFAAQAMVAESWQNPDHWYQTNVVANVRLHDQLRHINSLRKYVHVSTPEVYGSCSGLVDESHPFSPSTPYATSRAACDMHLLNFFKNYDFPVVFTRAANVYGPGQQLYRIIPRTILYIKLGKKLQLHGGGKSLRSFIHIRDVAKATLDIADKATPPETFHLSTDQHVSIRSLVELICLKMGADFKNLVELSPDRPGKDAAYLLDSGKVKKELNWAPEVSLEEGIEETIDWVQKNFDELVKEPIEYIHKI